MRHIVGISGKDSAATAVLVRRAGIDAEYFYNATGSETPEVEAWLGKMEEHLGKSITRIGLNLAHHIRATGMLPSPRARYCTRQAKIEPMEKWIGTDPATLYLGIRADERRVGYEQRNKRLSITPRYPLIEAGYGLDDVWRLIDNIDIAPPTYHWPRLEARVRAILGEQQSLIDGLSRAQRIGLFAGRSRPNCSFCFFQMAHEWVWLRETHPALFAEAIELEEEVGGDGYTWRKDEPLAELGERAEVIFERRAQRVAAQIAGTAQMRLFEDEPDAALINVVSCGLFCGK